MIGIRLTEEGPVVDPDLPEPQPACGEALVRILSAGICGTDLALLAGYSGFSGVIGHEFVGEVLEAPDASGKKGKRVVGRISIGCGECPPCRRGSPGHCEKRRVLGIRGADGVFAERCRIPVDNLVFVPDRVSDDAAVFAEPIAAALRIVEQVPVDSLDRALVVGAGCLGQLVSRVLAGRGCPVETVARHPRQRERLEAAGIGWVAEKEAAERGYDLVVEATGSPGGFDAARRCVRPEGTLVLKSSLKQAVPVDLSALVVDEIRVVGSRCGPLDDAVRWLARATIDPTDLIDARFALVDAPAAFEKAVEAGTLKIIFDC